MTGAALSQAQEQGRGARRAGLSRRDNPFAAEDPKRLAWVRGYEEQKQQDFARTCGMTTTPRNGDPA